jgi:hypothetical protein
VEGRAGHGRIPPEPLQPAVGGARAFIVCSTNTQTFKMSSSESATQKQCRIKTGVVQRCADGAAGAFPCACGHTSEACACMIDRSPCVQHPEGAAPLPGGAGEAKGQGGEDAHRGRGRARRAQAGAGRRGRAPGLVVEGSRSLSARTDTSGLVALPFSHWQVEVQAETEVMIPDSMRRLQVAVDDLREFMVRSCIAAFVVLRLIARQAPSLPHSCSLDTLPPLRAGREQAGAGGLGAAGGGGERAAGCRRRRGDGGVGGRRENMSVAASSLACVFVRRAGEATVRRRTSGGSSCLCRPVPWAALLRHTFRAHGGIQSAARAKAAAHIGHPTIADTKAS